MIFVTLGTQNQQFTRLIDMLENSTALKDEEIVVQLGNTKYQSDKLKLLTFVNSDELNNYIENAEIVITHGGVGSILDALKHKKKTLAVPRLEKYAEHVNDHQIEICEELENEGYILYLKDGENFDKKINLLRNTDFKEYVSDKGFLNIIENSINELLKK